MTSALVFPSLALGILLAEIGLTVRSDSREIPGFASALRLTSWLAAGALLIGGLVWPGTNRVITPAQRLIFMAALAAPAGIQRSANSRWSGAARILPALLMTGAGLVWSLAASDPRGDGSPLAPATPPLLLATILCGGIGARALGDVLVGGGISGQPALWSANVVCVLLTLLTGSIALANLLQRGAIWARTTDDGGLAGAWLAWCAACLYPRLGRWFRVAFVVTAALLLFWVVLMM